MRMRTKLPTVLVATLLVVAGAWVASVRKDLARMPRVRVGPLVSEAPPKPVMRFFALGDTGTGGEAQARVAAAMERRCAEAGGDGILLLGDNVYQIGVSSVDDPQWQTKVFEPYGGDCLGELPIYPVLGNHDYRDNPTAQIEQTLLVPRWHLPNRFYAVRFGTLMKLVAYDSQMSDLCFRPTFCSLDFLLDQVRGGDEDEPATRWTVVMGHHPLAASTTRQGHGYTGALRGLLLQPFLCNAADLYLAGHVHHLEHIAPEGCRLELVVSGGGGADLYDVAQGSVAASRFLRKSYGFAELEVSEESLVTRFFDDAGTMLYETRKGR